MTISAQEISDREEIRDVINLWAFAVDTGDLDTFESCYTPDAKIEFKEIGFQGATARGHREFLEKGKGLFKAMQHVQSNTAFLEISPTSARTRTMITAVTVMLNDHVFFMGVYYHDVLRKTPDGWRIAGRRAERVYTHNFPGEFIPENAPANKL